MLVAELDQEKTGFCNKCRRPSWATEKPRSFRRAHQGQDSRADMVGKPVPTFKNERQFWGFLIQQRQAGRQVGFLVFRNILVKSWFRRFANSLRNHKLAFDSLPARCLMTSESSIS